MGVVYAIRLFSGVIIFTVTWGSFDDFKGEHNLIIPLLIGAFGYFLAKPTIKHVKQNFDFDQESGAQEQDEEK